MYVRTFLIVVFSLCFAQVFASDAKEYFSQGAKHYKSKEYSEALTSFKSAADLDPLNADLNFDLGLVEYSLGHFGSALAYWRRTLDLSPWHTSAKEAIDYLVSQNKLKRMPEDGSLRHKLHESFLRFAPFHFFMMVTFLLFLGSIWSMMSFVGIRRRAVAANELPPTLNAKIPIFFSLWLIFCLLSVAKLSDNKTIRATVTVANTSLRTSPTEESASIIELSEGQEVVVQRQDSDWFQVNYLGKTTGWIQKSSALMSSGDFL